DYYCTLYMGSGISVF
nr:immunoglobulin light chain junction region [Macaca mulatta]MOV96921.1 immunoglobulin light chain junction region [Macaca mulatta]MOV98241.1 immunoglobulin light chain junction region [Macaca mulatta]MOV98444.1 immunoglobulin light chain junction region [Macaca mulatta]